MNELFSLSLILESVLKNIKVLSIQIPFHLKLQKEKAIGIYSFDITVAQIIKIRCCWSAHYEFALGAKSVCIASK